MFALIRRISPYTGTDILVGIFASCADCEMARRYYSDIRRASPKDDPWREQAYKDCALAEEDIVIEELNGEVATGAVAFVVSNHSDGFGQVVRTFDSVFETFSSASTRMEALDSIEDDEDSFPHYTSVDVVIVGRIHSDDPDDQPKPSWQIGNNIKDAESGRARRFFVDP